MAEYEKKLRIVLKSNLCEYVRHAKGDHELWYSPINQKKFTVDSKIKSRHMANTVLKQAGIDFKF